MANNVTNTETTVEENNAKGGNQTASGNCSKIKTFLKSKEGIALQVLLFPISIVGWLVYGIIKIPKILTGAFLKEIKENFLDYLFTKEIKNDKGETIAVKFVALPKIYIGAHFCVTIPLILAIIAHVFPHTDVACTTIALLLPLLSMLIVVYDVPVLRFWIYTLIAPIALFLIDIGWYKAIEYVFGRGIDIFSLINSGILGINPVFNTGAYLFMSIIWALALVIPVVHAILQSRFEITDREVYKIKIGERANVLSQYGHIISGKFDVMESIFSGTGGIKLKKFNSDEVDLFIENVPGLGNWLSTLLFCPWAWGVKRAIERLNKRDHSFVEN